MTKYFLHYKDINLPTAPCRSVKINSIKFSLNLRVKSWFRVRSRLNVIVTVQEMNVISPKHIEHVCVFT